MYNKSMEKDFEKLSAAEIHSLSREDLIRAFFHFKVRTMGLEARLDIASGCLEIACREDTTPIH